MMTFCFLYNTIGDGMESYGILCHFDWYTDVCRYRAALIFGVKQSGNSCTGRP